MRCDRLGNRTLDTCVPPKDLVLDEKYFRDTFPKYLKSQKWDGSLSGLLEKIKNYKVGMTSTQVHEFDGFIDGYFEVSK